VNFVHAKQGPALVRERLGHRVKRVRRHQKVVGRQIQAAPGNLVVGIAILQMLDHQGRLAHSALTGYHVTAPGECPASRQHAPIGPYQAPHHLAAQFKKGIKHDM